MCARARACVCVCACGICVRARECVGVVDVVKVYMEGEREDWKRNGLCSFMLLLYLTFFYNVYILYFILSLKRVIHPCVFLVLVFSLSLCP